MCHAQSAEKSCAGFMKYLSNESKFLILPQCEIVMQQNAIESRQHNLTGIYPIPIVLYQVQKMALKRALHCILPTLKDFLLEVIPYTSIVQE